MDRQKSMAIQGAKTASIKRISSPTLLTPSLAVIKTIFQGFDRLKIAALDRDAWNPRSWCSWCKREWIAEASPALRPAFSVESAQFPDDTDQRHRPALLMAQLSRRLHPLQETRIANSSA